MQRLAATSRYSDGFPWAIHIRFFTRSTSNQLFVLEYAVPCYATLLSTYWYTLYKFSSFRP